MNSSNSTSVSIRDFKRPLHLNIAMLIIGFLVSMINFYLIYRMQIGRNLLKAKRFAFLANLTFCDFTAGMVLICLATLNILGLDGAYAGLIHGESCLNTCLTLTSYACTIYVQFIAIKFPLYYKLSMTRTRMISLMANCWVMSLTLAIIKSVYIVFRNRNPADVDQFYYIPFVDVFVKISVFSMNCCCYGYVMVIAIRRRKNQLANIQEIDFDKNGSEEKNRGNAKAAHLKQYEAILTAGIRLVIYTITYVPLTSYCLYAVIVNRDDMTADQIYFDSNGTAIYVILIWFCRPIIDPLITLIREKPIQPYKHLTSISSGGRTDSSALGRTVGDKSQV